MMPPTNRQGRGCWTNPGAHGRPCHPAAVRPLLGYIRVQPLVTERQVEVLRRTMAAYASLEGFVLARVLVDRSFEHTTALAELVAALSGGEARHVLVPALHHFGHFEGVQLSMKQLLESQHGRVLVLFSKPSAGVTP